MSKRRVHPTDAVIARIARYLLVALLAVSAVVTVIGQTVRGARARGTVVQGEHGTAAVGPRGAAVKGDEGYAAVVVGEEGHAAAVGRHGGVVVANHYEDYDAWRVANGVAVGTAVAVGTMFARPPAAATPASAIIATLPGGCGAARVGAVA